MHECVLCEMRQGLCLWWVERGNTLDASQLCRGKKKKNTKNPCNQERSEILEEKAVGEERVSQALGAELKKDEGAVKREAEKEPRNKNMLGI